MHTWYSSDALPSAPRNILGPSTLVVWVENNAFEGVTVRSATRSCSITTGARKANSDKSTAVNASKGARYVVADLDKAEIIIRTAVREERAAGVMHSGRWAKFLYERETKRHCSCS